MGVDWAFHWLSWLTLRSLHAFERWGSLEGWGLLLRTWCLLSSRGVWRDRSQDPSEDHPVRGVCMRDLNWRLLCLRAGVLPPLLFRCYIYLFQHQEVALSPIIRSLGLCSSLPRTVHTYASRRVSRSIFFSLSSSIPSLSACWGIVKRKKKLERVWLGLSNGAVCTQDTNKDNRLRRRSLNLAAQLAVCMCVKFHINDKEVCQRSYQCHVLLWEWT